MIYLGTVNVSDKAKDNISKCLETGEIGQGKFIKEFEEKVAKYVGMEYAVSTCNGSMADIIALAALKEKYPNKKEVIVPALTFIAQTNAIYINGLKPVFVDINDNFQIDTKYLKGMVGANTLAIMPTHLLGKKCDIEKIVKLAGDTPVLEDCCETFGVQPKQIGTFSFFPSHTITTGEGGMIVTNDKELYELCCRMRNHGRKSENILDKFHFDVFGFNGKMSNMVAAMGCGVIDYADEVIKKRKENIKFINKQLGRNWEAESPHCYPYVCMTKKERNNKIEMFTEKGIEVRKLFSCLPTQEEVYQKKLATYNGTPWELGKGDFPKAEEIGEKGLYVPCHQNLTKEDLLKICQTLKSHSSRE